MMCKSYNDNDLASNPYHYRNCTLLYFIPMQIIIVAGFQMVTIRHLVFLKTLKYTQ